MGRRVVITKAQIIRNVQALTEAGLTIAGVDLQPDGTVRILTGAVDTRTEPAKDDRKPEPWT